MSAVHKARVLNLYKMLIQESKKFPAYNFRQYALRRIRHGFRENKDLKDENLIANQIQEANKNLDVIKRQALIGQMYSTDKLVIENVGKKL